MVRLNHIAEIISSNRYLKAGCIIVGIAITTLVDVMIPGSTPIVEAIVASIIALLGLVLAGSRIFSDHVVTVSPCYR